MPLKKLVLKAGREKSLLRRHPWVFSGGIAHIDGAVAAGDTVHILSNDGKFLAVGAANPDANISARVWDWSETTQINTAFFHKKLASAIEARHRLRDAKPGEAERLVHGESD